MDLLTKITGLRKSTNFRNGAFYTLFSFINNGISFILVLILARYLTPSDYGNLNLYNTFVTLLSIFISLSTNSYVSVSFFKKSIESLRRIILIVMGTSTCVLSLIAILMAVVPGVAEELTGVPVMYLWVALGVCYFQVFTNLNLDIWRLEEKPVSYGLFSMSFAVLNFVLTFMFIAGFGNGWEGRVYAQGLVTGSFYLISIVFLIKRRYLSAVKPDKALIRETFMYAIPLIPHAATYWVKQGLDRYIINYFHAPAEVGLFSFAMNFAAIISLVGNAFNATNSVYIYKHLADGYTAHRNKLSEQTRIMCFLFLALTIVVWLVTYIFIPIVLPKYADSTIYLLPLCTGAFFQCLYLLYVNYLFYYMRTPLLMVITVTGACVQLGLSMWLTRYSVLYTAWISCFVSFLTMALVMIFSKQTLKRQLAKEEQG